jgi:uncharacterized membrane protein YccC
LLTRALRAAQPRLLFGLRLWASVCLALYVAFWLELDNAYWAGTSAAIVCQPHLGASLRKGWYRMIGTVIGAAAIVVLSACFPQDRVPFLLGLALWVAGCALVGTLLRNLPFHAAVLSAVTAAIVAYDQLGATGGPNGEAFTLAITRTSEISIGIVSAGIVLAATDFGSVSRQLASLIAALSAEIARRLTGALFAAGSEFTELQGVRSELICRVIALDPVIDQAYGEAAELRYHAPVIQKAVDRLFAAMANWRAAAVLLAQLPYEQARQETQKVLARVPEEFRHDEPTSWLTDPIQLRRSCNAAVRQLVALPVGTPSLRLLADKTAVAFAGISAAVDALALLVAGHGQTVHRRSNQRHLRIPDWLPPLVNAGRAFVTVVAVELFWVITEWPSGALAIAFATIGTILFAARADQAYETAVGFMIGVTLAAALSAIIKFAVLPQLSSFPAFCLAIGLVLVPAGAGITQSWQTAAFTAMGFYFIPLLAPQNEMSYDTVQFYNSALAIVGGLGAATLSFRLLPPLSPTFRTRRLLALTLRDLRRLITRPAAWTVEDWEGRGYARLAALPEGAARLQRSHLLAALLVGAEIIQLLLIARRLGVNAELHAALAPLSGGDVTAATAGFAALDNSLAARGVPVVLRARARILAISQALIKMEAT